MTREIKYYLKVRAHRLNMGSHVYHEYFDSPESASDFLKLVRDDKDAFQKYVKKMYSSDKKIIWEIFDEIYKETIITEIIKL